MSAPRSMRTPIRHPSSKISILAVDGLKKLKLATPPRARSKQKSERHGGSECIFFIIWTPPERYAHQVLENNGRQRTLLWSISGHSTAQRGDHIWIFGGWGCLLIGNRDVGVGQVHKWCKLICQFPPAFPIISCKAKALEGCVWIMFFSKSLWLLFLIRILHAALSQACMWRSCRFAGMSTYAITYMKTDVMRTPLYQADTYERTFIQNTKANCNMAIVLFDYVTFWA